MKIDELIESIESSKNAEGLSIFNRIPNSDKKKIMLKLGAHLISTNSNSAMKAAIVLGEIKNQESCDTLLSGLSNPQTWVKREIITSLGKIGFKSAASYIRDLLAKDINTSLTKEFSEWIFYIRNSDSQLKKYSDEKLISIFESIIEAEIRTLGQLQDKDAIPLLSKALKHSDESIRLIAAESIGMIGSRSGLNPLVEILYGEEPSEDVLAQVIYSMKLIGDSTAAKYLKESPPLSSSALEKLKEYVIKEINKEK